MGAFCCQKYKITKKSNGVLRKAEPGQCLQHKDKQFRKTITHHVNILQAMDYIGKPDNAERFDQLEQARMQGPLYDNNPVDLSDSLLGEEYQDGGLSIEQENTMKLDM